MNKFIALLLLTAICTSAYSNDLEREVTETNPNVGEVMDAYLGDKIMSSQIGVYRNCITPKFNFEKSYLSVEAGKPICKETGRKNTYFPTYPNDNTRYDGAPGKRRVVFENNGKKIKFKFHRTLVSVKDLKESDFEIGETFIPNEESSQKHIEYAGRNGDLVRFNYVESSSSTANQTPRPFEVNLAEGNVGAYKGALFEILDANAAQLKYKVIRHFP